MTLTGRLSEITSKMDPCTEADYTNLKSYFQLFETISNAGSLNLLIIDFYKLTFHYVPDNSLILAGYSAQEVKERGFDHFEQTVPPDDLKMVAEISSKAFQFFYNLTPEERLYCNLSYDFRMKQSNGTMLMLHNTILPLFLTRKHYLWFALCLLELSVRRESGNVIFSRMREKSKYSYSFPGQRFKPYVSDPLTEREKEVLYLIKMGFTDDEIACRICIELNTVRFHKKNIYQKLHVTNSRQAIFYSGNK